MSPPRSAPDAAGARRAAPPRRSAGAGLAAAQPVGCRTCCCCPAVMLELLIHIVPMLVGIWMSFLKLTQFYIANWSAAPCAGLRQLPGRARLRQRRSARPCCTRSSSPSLFTCSSVGLSWLFGMAAAVAAAAAVPGPGAAAHAVPRAVRAAGLRRHHHLELHAPAGHRPGQPRPASTNLHLDRRPAVLADRRQQPSSSIVVVAVWRPWPFAFLMLMAGLQNIPDELYEAAAVDGAGIWRQCAHITLPLAAAGQPGAAAGAVPVDVQRLQHAVRAVRRRRRRSRRTSSRSTSTSARSSPGTSARLGDVGAAAAVPAAWSPAVYLLRHQPEEARRCVRPPVRFRVVPLGRADRARRCSPLVPLYVMVSSSLKPLQDVQGDFTWCPTHADHPAVHRHLDDGAAGAVLRQQPDRVHGRDRLLAW